MADRGCQQLSGFKVITQLGEALPSFALFFFCKQPPPPLA
jgi:hypothetical protein